MLVGKNIFQPFTVETPFCMASPNVKDLFQHPVLLHHKRSGGIYVDPLILSLRGT